MIELTPQQLTPDAREFLKKEAKGLLRILLSVLGEQIVKILIAFLARHNETKVIGYGDNDLFI